MSDVAEGVLVLTVSPIYLGLSALLLVVLSVRVVMGRRAHNVGVGVGGRADLELRIRAHGNCAEYLPLMMIVLLAIDLSGAPVWVVHLFGAVGVLSRIAHAAGISSSSGVTQGRLFGMIGTYAVLGFGGLGLIGHALL